MSPLRNPAKFQWPPTRETETARAQTADSLRVRGTGYLPPSPNGLRLAKSGTVITANWDVPVVQKSPIVGWRIYLDTESNQVQSIRDANCTQAQITIVAGSKHNVFISSVNALGKESALVSSQI